MIKVVCFSLLFMATLVAAPFDDLTSPDQAIRDAAAKILRASWRPTPRSRWGPFLASIELGMTRAAFNQLVAPYNTRTVPGRATRSTSCESCRLDDTWLLCLNFEMNDPSGMAINNPRDTLSRWEIIKNVQSMDVEIPSNFTGRWTTYYANGKKAEINDLHKGIRCGVFIVYNSDGGMHYLAHYDNAGKMIDGVNYYTSGKEQLPDSK
jgi:hypothetical protein